LSRSGWCLWQDISQFRSCFGNRFVTSWMIFHAISNIIIIRHWGSIFQLLR
jgi:hypothetical protein